MLGIFLARRLVGDERVRPRLARMAQELVDELLAGDELAAEAAADVAQELVERGQALRLVHDVDRDREVRARGEQQPLPIAVVRGEQHDRLPAVDRALDELGIDEFHTAPSIASALAPNPQNASTIVSARLR